MKNHIQAAFLCILLIILFPTSIYSNELYPVSLTDRVNKSTLIVEGEVISQTCFSEPGHKNIFTSNLVRLYRLFKGNITTQEIEVITYGGTLNGLTQVYSSYLKLGVGQTGIFFCMPSRINNGSGQRRANSYEVYSSMQGLIGYDIYQGTAADPFTRYASIEEVIGRVRRMTNTDKVISENPSLKQARTGIQLKETAAPSISSFTPSVPAGTGQILTINGAGFGATRGTGGVEFKNADNGGASWVKPLSTDYISWTDGQIQVRVPSYSTVGSSAGTGTIRVINSDPDTVVSSTALTVPYSYSNIPLAPQTPYQPVHYAWNNGSGGYIFQLNTSFAANKAASAAFARAMQTWTCHTGINWVIEGTTSVDTVDYDGVNVVRFESTDTLPNGVLGVCSSWYGTCSSPLQAIVLEIDVVFNDAVGASYSWQFGPADPASGQVDFETVALHEMGHGQQLSHVISPGAVMHFGISMGQKTRTLSSNDISGGNVITTADFAGALCVPVMTAGGLFLVVTDTPAICSAGSFSDTAITGGTNITYNWTRPTIAGISNATASGSGPINESLVNTTGSPILVNYNFSLTNGSCTGSDVVYVTVNPQTTTLAGTAGGGAVCTSQTMISAGATFSDASCNPMGKVVPAGSTIVGATVNFCATVASSVPSVNGQPYVARHYDITPSVDGPATVTLYFTQADFTAYNAANGTYPDLPTGSGDATGIANLRITQFHGTSATGLPGSYSGSTEFIDPVDGNIVYNASQGRWEISFSVTSFSGFFVHTGSATLPLKLLQFSGRKAGSSNVLNWTTSNEKDIFSFVIQRSTDGVNFSAVGEVKATNTATIENKYTYADEVANLSQPVYYYRLQIKELNGSATFSKVIQITDKSGSFVVKVWQNPFGQQLQLNVTSPQVQEASLLLTDLNGRRLSQRNIVLQEGNGIIDIPGVQSLASGTYLLTVITAGNKVVNKVVKQ